MEDQLLPTAEETQPEVVEATEEAEAGEEPTKSVKNFWERLDEVFNLSKQTNQNLEQILEQFPETAPVGGVYRSAIFQPERVCVSSNNSQEVSFTSTYTPLTEIEGHYPGETFYQFKNRLNRALVGVKSIQLLSATIPNAIANIPDRQTIFFYYKIPALSTDALPWSNLAIYQPGDVVTYLGNYYVAIDENNNVQPDTDSDIWYQQAVDGPNYYKIFTNPEELINVVILIPTFAYSPDLLVAGTENLFNRTFQDYQDLVDALNECANAASNASDPGDTEFTYNSRLNKITFEGLSLGYFYMPCGYNDQNIRTYLQGYALDPFWTPPVPLATPLLNPFDMWSPGNTLNVRLGFTWNGDIPFFDPQNTPVGGIQDALWNYIRPTDPAFLNPYVYQQEILTFNSYPDLVNTSCVRLLCDIVQGSTEDANEQVGLLSIVPINTNNLGVAFYQNNFNNELTKIPKIITEIGITMLTDQGLPFYLPNSAVVLLELGITYH